MVWSEEYNYIKAGIVFGKKLCFCNNEEDAAYFDFDFDFDVDDCHDKRKQENTMKLLILSLVLLFNMGYLHQTSAATPEKKPSITWSCNEEDAKAVDKIVARIMTYGRLDRKFPVNKPELRAYCK